MDMELFDAHKKLIETKLILKKAVENNRKAKEEVDFLQNKKIVFNITQKPKTTGFIHMHYGVQNCSNVFIKCNVSDAYKLFENLPLLNMFVKINTLNSEKSDFMLNKVKMSVCTEILENQSCKEYCDICLIKNSYKYKNWNCEKVSNIYKCHSHYAYIKSSGDLYYYKKTNLFESTMLYCLQSLIKEMIEQLDVKIIISDSMGNYINDSKFVQIQKVTLIIDSEKKISVKIPMTNFQIKPLKSSNFPFFLFEPITLNDIKLISTVNDFVKIYKTIIDYDSKNKLLIMKYY